MFEERPSPIVAPAATADKLPRMALLALLVIYIIPGLLSRDFWSSHELESFAVISSMLSGGIIDWLLPHIDGVQYVKNGPLSMWVGALFAKLFGWLFGEDSASRLSVLVWFAIATSSIWYGTWYVARRAEAQPVVLAFGGEASPRDYGRVVADAALLMFVGTFGLFVPIRQLFVDMALLAIVALFYFSLTWSFRRSQLGPLLTGATAGAAVLCADLFTGVIMLAVALLLHARVHAYDTPFISRSTLIIVAAAAVFFAWPVVTVGFAIETIDAWFATWWETQLAVFGLMRAREAFWSIENFIWFLWPVWPFALLSIYAFRKQIGRTHIKIALWTFGGFLIFSIFGNVTGERYLTLLTPGLCVLAAFGLMSTRRSWANILDWFSATVFTIALLTIWGYFIAWLTGFPPKMQKSIFNLAPGVDPSLHGLLFVLCFVTFLAWITLVLWRMNRSQVMAWKGPWLAAAGVTALSITTVYLFEPAIDNARSFEPVAQSAQVDFAALAPKGQCISTTTLTPVQKMTFKYYGLALSNNSHCRWYFEAQRELENPVPEHRIAGTYSRPRDGNHFILIKPE